MIKILLPIAFGLSLYGLGIASVLNYHLRNKYIKVMYFTSLISMAVYCILFIEFGCDFGVFILSVMLSIFLRLKTVRKIHNYYHTKEVKKFMDGNFEKVCLEFKQKLFLFNNGVTGNKYELSSYIKGLDDYKELSVSVDNICDTLENLDSLKRVIGVSYFPFFYSALAYNSKVLDVLTGTLLFEKDEKTVNAIFEDMLYTINDFRFALTDMLRVEVESKEV